MTPSYREPSVLQPAMATDIFREKAVAARKWADQVRREEKLKQQAYIAESDARIADAEAHAAGLEKAYQRMLDTGAADDKLYPSGAAEMEAKAKREVKRGEESCALSDEGSLRDLKKRLEGSYWEIVGKPKRRNGVFSVRLEHLQRTTTPAEARQEAKEMIAKARESYKQQWDAGVLGFTPGQLHELSVSEAMLLPYELAALAGGTGHNWMPRINRMYPDVNVARRSDDLAAAAKIDPDADAETEAESAAETEAAGETEAAADAETGTSEPEGDKPEADDAGERGARGPP